jgi:hypothetical protein
MCLHVPVMLDRRSDHERYHNENNEALLAARENKHRKEAFHVVA